MSLSAFDLGSTEATDTASCLHLGCSVVMDFLELAPNDRNSSGLPAEFSQFWSFGSLNFLGVSGTSEITIFPITSYR
ncbi:hypothetical protein TNCV_2700971, partial [Trichonephila clavipes]